jgi:acyl dehydratase
MSDAARRIHAATPADLKAFVGAELGPSTWMEVTLDRVRMFAEATLDPQWIHVDAERARRESAYGGMVAHGFFLLSALPHLLSSLIEIEKVSFVVNKGATEVRFPAAVPVGRRVCAWATLLSVTETRGGVDTETRVRVVVEGARSPSCVAVLQSGFFA